MNDLKVKEKLQSFFLEDIGDRDLSTNGFQEEKTTVTVVAKQAGTMAGIDLLRIGYQLLDDRIEVIYYKKDGDDLGEGDLIARITGPIAPILSGERVLLNLIQRMSGIATATNAAIRKLNDPSIQITDTRKTTPGLRIFEKYSVRCGGGVNHRYGLYDAIMIKDNHVDASGGSIHDAMQRAKAVAGPLVKIEVEVRNEQEGIEAVSAEADVIMFDNVDPTMIRSWREWVPKTIITEASGGIHSDSLPHYQGCGVNYISLGYLTHSAKALDISMIHSKEEKLHVFS
ncbi:nicotinate-nucleotide pyrophosphorylase (carboxylating) [Geomicrobium halophilum]|uniref:Probable nicotinate-nucleotide pyrophosphorylase [carboxylating] n=1 Tax=Geomicrobium halophilum TaxID=549000 RepID=A0A841PZR8_9BACL|nr:carboxylating nicotinate-nucleotide diphosphorylase [Geomicrobium halophilum]MBB6450075.1 nicotinate-nucleotide pyrophosphorylase (carboxylating) [Geomicrobium halophilum]